MDSYEYTVRVTNDTDRMAYVCQYTMKYKGRKVRFTTHKLLSESELLKQADKAYEELQSKLFRIL